MEAYRQSTECENSRSWPDLNYYQGLSFLELGENERAEEKFSLLQRRGSTMLESHLQGSGIGVEEGGSAAARRSASEGYYLQGLALLGNGDHQNAAEMFGKGYEFSPYNLWAKYYLER